MQKGKIYEKMSEVQQFNEVNTILYESVKAYWNWVIDYNHLMVYNNSIDLAETRFEGVKKSYQQGVEPAIDTLEAFIQLQNRRFSYNKAKLELHNLN